MGIGGFISPARALRRPEEKTIDTTGSSPMIAPPVLPQSAFCALKKIDWPKLDRFKFLILDILSARRVSAEKQLESQSESEPMGSSGIPS